MLIRGGSMTQTLLDEKLQLEIDKLKKMQQSDLNSQRLIDGFTVHFKKKLEELKNIDDGQLLLQSAVELLNSVPVLLLDFATEVSNTRREQGARINAIQDCRDVLVEEAEVQAREEARIQELADKIKDGENVKSRKIGEHPSRLKEIRKAQDLVSEEQQIEEEADDVEVIEDEEQKEE